MTVEHSNYISCDSWLNGVTLNLGPGFDASTVSYISAPSLTWISAIVANDMPVESIGWGYDAWHNGNPFSSWGRSGAGPFVFELEVQVIGLAGVSSLDVDVFYSTDFDTGAYSGGDCGTINSPDGPYLLSPAITLPIKLTSFYAVSNENVNVLNWVTETEVNNDLFILQKSYDAINFEEVEVLNGAGNSVRSIKYEAVDLAPQKLTYYRLTQVDFDGDSETFKVISVVNNYSESGSNTRLLQVVNAFGQVVNDDYTGVVIEHYSDGTAVKKIKM
jgi:hypothetical protein